MTTNVYYDAGYVVGRLIKHWPENPNEDDKSALLELVQAYINAGAFYAPIGICVALTILSLFTGSLLVFIPAGFTILFVFVSICANIQFKLLLWRWNRTYNRRKNPLPQRSQNGIDGVLVRESVVKPLIKKRRITNRSSNARPNMITYSPTNKS